MHAVPAYLPAGLEPLPPRILSCRIIPIGSDALMGQFACKPHHVSLGMLTCDQDDSLYAALDHATKFANVQVVSAQSFYAGSSHASGPFSGEILGVLAGPDPDEIAEGLEAARDYLDRIACFYQVPTASGVPTTVFPHVIAETGHFLSAEAGIAAGTPLAYLIAPPMESTVALDAALKAADVRMCRYFAPPTPTNFGGAYLTGDLAAVEAAAAAFAEAVMDVARWPLQGLRRPERDRR